MLYFIPLLILASICSAYIFIEIKERPTLAAVLFFSSFLYIQGGSNMESYKSQPQTKELEQKANEWMEEYDKVNKKSNCYYRFLRKTYTPAQVDSIELANTKSPF